MVTFATDSYVKIFMHASKFPSEAIGGFLLGDDGLDGLLGFGGETSRRFVTDVLPVYHGTPVGPILDNAAMIVDAMVGKKIIGFYYAVSPNSDPQSGVTRYPRYLDGIMKGLGGSDSILVTIGGELDISAQIYSSKSSSKVTTITIYSGNEGGSLAPSLSNPAGPIGSTKEQSSVDGLIDRLLMNSVERSLIDFQDHMDNSASDFRNTDVTKHIANLAKDFGFVCESS